MYVLYTIQVLDSCINKKVSGYDQETVKHFAPIGQKQYEKFVKT